MVKFHICGGIVDHMNTKLSQSVYAIWEVSGSYVGNEERG